MMHRLACLGAMAALLAGCGRTPPPRTQPAAPVPVAPTQSPAPAAEPIVALVPQPALVERGAGTFEITAATAIVIPEGGGAPQRIGSQLAEMIRRTTGDAPRLLTVAPPGGSTISLVLAADRD